MNKQQAREAKMMEAEKAVMDIRRQVSDGEIWRHLRSGRKYEVEGIGLIEKTMKPAIIYRATGALGILWVRPADEFLDGRFVRMSGE